uniref:Ubiquitin-like protein ATG12 n=1 Tax=Ditylum brightwellii TaxID=49249 RepID=A0A6V2GZD0_9STRA|mmetsp:Transcript_19488/g.28230  ORF Transcript_19488/g.28230 Transcript_19488/m.28230 type:complete len:174 (-) Transcript_19488:381-902(-)|eukprot:12670417-Ditylum_brightwellii.AAC.1
MEKNDGQSENNSSDTQATPSSQDAKKNTSISPDDNNKSLEENKPSSAVTATSLSEASPSKTSPTKAPSQSRVKASSNSSSKDVIKKVKVHFVAVGSAPLMKKNKFQIAHDQRFAAVSGFLRKMLKLTGTGTSLFLYLKSAFVPSPDELVGDLNDCFSVRGELVIHYSLQEAWG